MTELVFPVFGTAFVVWVALPLFALVTKSALVLLERTEVSGPLHGLSARYLLLTGSSVLPLAWLLSAGLHQAESGKSALACLFDHDAAELCLEPGFFAFLLSLVVVALAIPAVRERTASLATSANAHAVAERIARLILAHSALSRLRGRVHVTDQVDFALGTLGLWRPRVVIGANYATKLTDDMLVSALGHEQEHVRAYDPLRYFLLRLAIAINPWGRFLLDRHAARWIAAREAHCDRQAVVHGSSALALAEAIIAAARPRQSAVALGTSDAAVLKLRVEMLVAFAERAPTHCCHQGPSAFPMVCALVVFAVVLPHQTGTQALDALHAGAEHALTYLWR